MFKSKGKQQLYIGQNGQYISLATHHGDWFRDNYQFVMDYTLLPHVNTIMGTKTVSFNFLLLLPTTESSERKGQYRVLPSFIFLLYLEPCGIIDSIQLKDNTKRKTA